MSYATVQDVEDIFRPLSEDEKKKAARLLIIVSESLDYEAAKVGKNLTEMMQKNPSLVAVARSVTVDVVARALMTSTNSEPMTQVSQSALGYTMSGTYLVPGGGLFIAKRELQRLGLRRQRIGAIECSKEST